MLSDYPPLRDSLLLSASSLSQFVAFPAFLVVTLTWGTDCDGGDAQPRLRSLSHSLSFSSLHLFISSSLAFSHPRCKSRTRASHLPIHSTDSKAQLLVAISTHLTPCSLAPSFPHSFLRRPCRARGTRLRHSFDFSSTSASLAVSGAAYEEIYSDIALVSLPQKRRARGASSRTTTKALIPTSKQTIPSRSCR